MSLFPHVDDDTDVNQLRHNDVAFAMSPRLLTAPRVVLMTFVSFKNEINSFPFSTVRWLSFVGRASQ